MAIKDALANFGSSQDVAQNASGSEASTESIPLGVGEDAFGSALNPEYGDTGKLYIVIMAVENVTGVATSVLQIQVQTDTVSNFATPTTLGTYTKAVGTGFAAGTEILRIPFPIGGENYMRLYYTALTANITACVVDAFVAWGPDNLVK